MDTEELRQRLSEALHFSSLDQAEESLRLIHALYTGCLEAGNREGVRMCRQRVVEGKKRAFLMSRNRRVSPDQRMRKEEVRRWFLLWLEDPATFFKWLALRKETEEYRRLAASEKR